MSTSTQIPLSKIIKRILDACRILAFAGLILWPLLVAGLAIGRISHPESWGVDIGVFSGFVIDLGQLQADTSDSVGVRNPQISGKAVLGIDTSSKSALYLFAVITELGGIVGLYVLLQLRAVFASLVSGTKFSIENSQRIKKIGFVIIAWAFVNPILQYFGGRAILNEYAISTPVIQLNPAFELSLMAIFIGSAMIVLSGVLNEATKIHQDQQLTI